MSEASGGEGSGVGALSEIKHIWDGLECGLIAWKHSFRGDDGVKGGLKGRRRRRSSTLDTIIAPNKRHPSDQGREVIRLEWSEPGYPIYVPYNNLQF
jgi:hypothetical protein